VKKLISFSDLRHFWVDALITLPSEWQCRWEARF